MKTPTLKRARFALVLLVAAMSLLVATTSNAGAYNGTYVYSKKLYAGVPACGAIGCPYGPGYIVRDNTAFAMVCYKDGPYKYGNYGSTRWFRGFMSGISGQVWVHSSYVYNQVRVGRC